MKVSIIPDDQMVVKDGVSKKLSFIMDTNIQAIHWHGNSGWIEKKKGDPVKLDNFDDYSDLLAQFDNTKTPIEIIQEEQISVIAVEERVTHLTKVVNELASEVAKLKDNMKIK